MLAITTTNGTSLIDPASFKDSSSVFQISSSLECSTSSWSPDNSQLYLSHFSSIKRYTLSECLLEDLYNGSDSVTCMEMRNNNTLFFAATNKVWSLDCTQSPGRAISSLEPHKNTITKISMSNDGILLASVSSSAVFVHNLALSSHTQLRGLPDKEPVSCCLFHQHSSTRLLLGVGRELVVYDATKPSSPLKTVRIPGSGDIVGVATSPFSKTLVAVVVSGGDVALVDLDKDSGVLKTVNVKTPLTCCAFTAEGAAIYLGTESGKILILDLRSLEKEPRSFIIGDGDAPIDEINVQVKFKSHPNGNANKKVKSSPAVVKLSPQRSESTTRTTGSIAAGSGIRSPMRVTAAPRIRGGGGVIPKKKLFSPARAPLSETQNVGIDARLAASRSSTLSHRTKPLRLQRSKQHEENREAGAPLPSLTFREPTELASARQRTKPSLLHKMEQDVAHLGFGSAPESISGHLTAMRARSSSILDDDSKEKDRRPQTVTSRVISEPAASVFKGRKPRSASSISTQSRSLRAVRGVLMQAQRSTTPDNADDHLDLSSPELPHEPVTPISLGKNAIKVPLVSATISEVASQKGKERERVVEAKKTSFSHHLDAKESPGRSDGSEDKSDLEIFIDEQGGEQDQELSLQVSPRRPTAPPAWLQSPHRPSAANLNMNGAAQDFLRSIVHDVMYDFQRDTKAELMGLHLDLVRMGRGWRQELRETMKEMQELKAENERLRAENERLRRG